MKRDDKEAVRQAAPCVLTINGGSSSIKFALFRIDSLQRILGGRIERIGLPDAVFTITGAGGEVDFTRSMAIAGHASAAVLIMDWFKERAGGEVLKAVGHRVVHGGSMFSRPQLITPQILDELGRLSSFDPRHLPAEILLMETIRQRFADIPQVACFDTAFHHDMPRVAQLLPIPRKYGAKGVRRYGFHGLSYEFLMEELARVAGAGAAKGRVILAHLGNGASLAAVRGGKPMDTSMGFTPAAGVPMSTRSGDLDPGLVWYLAETERMGAKEFNEMVNSRSGLLGVSETSSDMLDLLGTKADDVRAAEAVEMFCYHVKKSIGAFAAVLGGLDTLVFSGGIGERAPEVRAGICAGLGFLGVELDDGLNAAGEGLISVKNSKAAVRVIQTNEELIIARSVGRVLSGS